MNAERLALAQRVVKLPGWRWLPGMRYGHGDGAGRVDVRVMAYVPNVLVGPPTNAIPDLDDDVTRLALAAVARAVWGNGLVMWAELSPVHDCWMVCARRPGAALRVMSTGPTEEFAWYACIEAASAPPVSP